MTTFKTFLSEMAVVGDDEPNKIEAIAKFIKRDCQQYLGSTQAGSFLYRGIAKNFNTGMGTLYRFKVPVDRTPADSPPWLHTLWNEIIEEKLHIQGARDRSIFASTSQKQASSYMGNSGSIYIVLPVGPYNMLWDDEVEDSFLHVKTLWMRIIKQQTNMPQTNLEGAQEVLDDQQFEFMKQELKNALLQHYDMDGSPFNGSSHEVYFMSTEYYAINIGRAAGGVDRDQEAFIKGLTSALWR